MIITHIAQDAPHQSVIAALAMVTGHPMPALRSELQRSLGPRAGLGGLGPADIVSFLKSLGYRVHGHLPHDAHGHSTVPWPPVLETDFGLAVVKPLASAPEWRTVCVLRDGRVLDPTTTEATAARLTDYAIVQTVLALERPERPE